MRYRFLRFPQGKEKAVTFSYDDGCLHDKKLIEIADKYGIKVTLNINTASAGKDEWHLSFEQLKELSRKGGHEIAVHGANHLAPGISSLTDGIKDVLQCRQLLEQSFGRIIRGMAYPDSGITRLANGVTKEQIKAYLRALGIVYARSLGGDNDRFELPQDYLEWIPTAHHGNPDIFAYIEKFVNAKAEGYCAARTPLLFYLWGHSYEFNNNNNWNRLEAICQGLGEKSDTWYATNIEIYDYVRAYRALEFNVDNTLVYNPTATKVWFNGDGETYSVAPGETKQITE